VPGVSANRQSDGVPDSDPLITARFSLVWSSAVDVAQITERIGLTPSTVWTRGETRVSPSGHRYPKPYERSGWQIAVGPRRTIDMPAVLDELLATVRAAVPRIRDAVTDLGVHPEVSLHIKVVDQAPVGTISRDAIALLNEIGAELDLDLYVVDETYDEPIGRD
jgi:hypothetical protein